MWCPCSLVEICPHFVGFNMFDAIRRVAAERTSDSAVSDRQLRLWWWATDRLTRQTWPYCLCDMALASILLLSGMWRYVFWDTFSGSSVLKMEAAGSSETCINIVTIYVWLYGLLMDLFATYTHHSELQIITALSPIPTIDKSQRHPQSLLQPAVFTSRSITTASNNGDSSASHAQILLSQPPVQNSCQLTTPL
jgi:hypothetical protein